MQIPRPIVYKDLNAFYGEGAKVIGLGGVGAGGNFLNITDETRDEIAMTDYAPELEYTPGDAPIEVKVYDPLRIKNGSFILEFNDNDGNNDLLAPNARWRIYPENDPGDFITSERSIATLNEQIIGDYGFTVSLGQTDDVGDRVDDANGAIGATIEYLDAAGPQWFAGVPDGQNVFNYIKTDAATDRDFLLDPTQALSTIGAGIFTPFHLCDYDQAQPGQLPFIVSPTWLENGEAQVRNQSGAELQRLNNVDIVLTSDKTKWSRCIVVDTYNDYFGAIGDPVTVEGNSDNMEIRDALSVGQNDSDGDGAADPDGAVDANGNPLKGYGWFPGYAVDVESGKRLNIFFGENSAYSSELQAVVPQYPANGRDMIWNPTGDVFTPIGGFPSATDFSMGGMHYIYVTHEDYDGCETLGLDLRINGSIFNKFRGLPKITWAAMPILLPETELLSYNDGLIPNDVIIRLRVDNPYAMEEEPEDVFQYPKYKIVFDNVEAADKEDGTEINAALAQINVVPNPYFAFSEYETSQFTQTVKITNLPDNCTVTIYSLDGRFIRQYKRNEIGIIQSPPRANAPIPVTQTVPDIEWNLKNSKGIPISSGVYIIHVDAPGLGERVIKWFGVNRKFDPAGL